MHSGLMCIDFDHVADLAKLKEQLLGNEYFDTEPVVCQSLRQRLEVDYPCCPAGNGAFSIFQGRSQLPGIVRTPQGGQIGLRRFPFLPSAL